MLLHVECSNCKLSATSVLVILVFCDAKVKKSEADMLGDLQAQQLELRQRNMRERCGEIGYLHGT